MAGIVVFPDGSDMKRADEALNRTEQRYHDLVDGLRDGVYRRTDDGRFVEVNQAMVDMLGYESKEDLMAIDIKTDLYLDPAGSEKARPTPGERTSAMFRLRHKDGSTIWAEDTSTYTGDENGDIVFHEGILRDITNEIRQEEELRLSEASYRALVDNATYGICRTTGGGEFLTVNPALIEILGFESECELLRTTAVDVFADPESIARIIGRIRDPDDTEPVETIWKRDDGKSVAVRLSGRAVSCGGVEAECLEMIVEDVSSQRDLQDQLRQAQKMEALGQLTGGIAHDFNNVLSVILANSQLLAAALEGDNSPLAADARDIEHAAVRAAAVVKKLMSISRQADLSMEPTDLGNVVLDIAAMMRSVLPENVEVDIAVPEQVPAALTDASAVEQMLLNLATNARDAMPHGGKINIEVAHEQVDPQTAGEGDAETRCDFIRVALSDTGIGMDEATKARIFEPFFTTKPDGKGTGIGLAMVFGLMQQLGGFPRVDSTPGQGTTIALYFPATERCAESPAAGEARNARLGGGETILLVEDELALRRAGKRTLEKFGYTVLEADNGEDAVALCRNAETTIDLIISDLMMPKMDGQQLRRVLLEEALTAKFMFTTGYRDGDPFSRSGSEDGVPILHKPWTIDELLHQVRHVLDENEFVA